jgi:HEAT repeats
MRFITLLSVLFLASVLMAADPIADENSPALSSPSSATDAIEMLGKLPNPLVEKHLVDFFASASTEDAGKVLMHIAISAVRPARAVVIPVLGHRDPQVVERALRTLSSIGINSTEVREKIETLLNEGEPPVALQAAICLGFQDDKRAVPALIARMTKGPTEVAGAALTSLQRLTSVDFKSDAITWNAWYDTYHTEALQRLNTHADMLTKAEAQKQIAGIQALAGMRGERQESIDLIEPMLNAADPTVVMSARQALATLAPMEYAMPTAAEVTAVTNPAPVVTEAKAQGMIAYLSEKGLFDTWYGVALTAFSGILILSGVLFLLRTGPVKNATRRIGRVVAAGTMRLARPLTKQVQKGTKRIIRAFTQNKSSTDKKA